MTAHLRAAHHLSLCPQCAAEVDAQRQARAALRDSHPIVIPTSLLGTLSQIPQDAPQVQSEDNDPSQFADGTSRDRRKRR
jgi:hypothetical protein